MWTGLETVRLSTRIFCQALRLKTGDEAFAAFKASHVILGVE